MIGKYSLQLLSITCNAARSLRGDRVIITFAGRHVWSSKDILLHEQNIALVNFVEGVMSVNAQVVPLPAFTPEKFCHSINDLPAILKVQANSFFNFYETIGRIVVQPSCMDSTTIHQRIQAMGADYCMTYRLTMN